MTRLQSFIGIGPLISWLMCISYLVVTVYPKPVFDQDWYWFASVIFCYVFTVPAMLVASWIDRRLSERWWRSAVCFAAGFGIAVALYYQFLHEGTPGPENAKLFRDHWPSMGLIWGLPAAVCSWLTRA